MALGGRRTLRLPVVHEIEQGKIRVCVDLTEQAMEGEIWLWVPEVWAPIMADQHSIDIERRSFSTCSWGFSCEFPTSNEIKYLQDEIVPTLPREVL